MGSFVYDTNALIQTVPNLKTAQTFLLDRFFPNFVTADTEEISIDVDVGLRRMAPFVSPLVQGNLLSSVAIKPTSSSPHTSRISVRRTCESLFAA